MKLLLLDKDGTIVTPKSGAKFVKTPWDQEPIPGVSEKLEKYRSEGWTIVVCSNQGGIEAGYKTEPEAIQEMRFCLELFPQIEECYFAPDMKGNYCIRYWRNEEWSENCITYSPNSVQTKELDLQGEYRKPKPGMLLMAIDVHGASLGDCLYVGDRPEDEQAAVSAGIEFRWAANWLK